MSSGSRRRSARSRSVWNYLAVITFIFWVLFYLR